MIHRARHIFAAFPASGVPIYRQIADQVKQLVAAGRLADGDLLPSVRETAVALQINHMTVSKAYSMLEAEGVVQRLAGKGMRVCASPSSKDTVAQRVRELEPHLRQVLAKAYQLALTPEQVRRAFESLLKEMDHER